MKTKTVRVFKIDTPKEAHNFRYVGEELDTFAHALNWKDYFSKLIAPYCGSQVLEVGAGLGETSAALASSKQESWLCLEPDPVFCQKMIDKLEQGCLPDLCTIRQGIIKDLAEETQKFDSILYIDVLEHIERDLEELKIAAGLLKPGGYLIVLCPAFPYVYSAFDKQLGHYRRYTRKNLKKVMPDGFSFHVDQYLDSVGLGGSLINKWFLEQDTPSLKQVLFWDRWLIPCSRLIDWAAKPWFGKSVVVVGQKPQ